MLPSGRIVDLTQALGPKSLLWPGSPEVGFDAIGSLEREGYFARAVRTPEHAGTHLDAPAHFDPGGETTDEIAAERLVVRGFMLDVAARCADEPATEVGAADIEAFEHEHGAIEPGSALLLRTGWDERREDAGRFFGKRDDGSLTFPGFDASAADFLLARGAAGLGTDTLSVDAGRAADFPVHRITLPAGLWHLEGLVALDQLPACGFTLFVGSLPLEGGSGTPARVLAMLDG